MYVPATTLRQPGLLAKAQIKIDREPEKYSMAGGDGLKSAAAAVKCEELNRVKSAAATAKSMENITVLNASRVAAARATEGFLECRYAGCHRSVTRSKRNRGATTCGKTNCPKN